MIFCYRVPFTKRELQHKGCVRIFRYLRREFSSFFESISRFDFNLLILRFYGFLPFPSDSFACVHLFHSANERSIENRFHWELIRKIIEKAFRDPSREARQDNERKQRNRMGEWWHVGTREMLMFFLPSIPSHSSSVFCLFLFRFLARSERHKFRKYIWNGKYKKRIV